MAEEAVISHNIAIDNKYAIEQFLSKITKHLIRKKYK